MGTNVPKELLGSSRLFVLIVRVVVAVVLDELVSNETPDSPIQSGKLDASQPDAAARPTTI